MNRASTGASEATIRQLNPSLTTFSRPFTRAGAHVGARMTAIKLSTGFLALYNPTELDTETRQKLDELGPIEYIIAPSLVHHVSLDEYAAAYPKAKLIGPQGIGDKHKHLQFYQQFQAHNEPLQINDTTPTATTMPDADAGAGAGAGGADRRSSMSPSLQSAYFPDVMHKEILLFHSPTKTMMCADLIWNLPATEQYSKANMSESEKHNLATRVADHTNPTSALHKTLSWLMIKRTPAVQSEMDRVMNQWKPQTIIPQHGDVITTGALDKVKQAFAWALGTDANTSDKTETSRQ